MPTPFFRAACAAPLVALASGCAMVGDGPNRMAADDRQEGARRFALTPLTEMTAEQRAVADASSPSPAITCWLR